MAFSSIHEGLQIIALQNKPGRGLVKDEIYIITDVLNSHQADINSTGSGIRYTHQGTMWDFLHAYTQNQQFVECISFATGILLFILFSKGFTGLSFT